MRKIYTALILLLLSLTLFAHEGTTVDNGDETFTYTQIVDKDSTEPYYTKPDGTGFNIYAYFNEDYGWTHDFPDYETTGLNITGATLTIVAWDVDSEPKWGTGGEYDGIAVDGTDLNPGLLQGKNNTTSTTVFDIPTAAIFDDGNINVFLDIDMNHTARTWATKLYTSTFVISYAIDAENEPPFIPEIAPPNETAVPSADEDLVINITGPATPDSNGDEVDYNYRWFVDVGQGYKVDDEFAGKQDNKTNRVSADQVEIGETWSVDVTAEDSSGALSSTISYDFQTVTDDKDGDGVLDEEDDYPDDPTRAFNSYYPSEGIYNTMFFEDSWPQIGDYDFNDLIFHLNYRFVTDASNKLKDIFLSIKLVAKGASQSNALALQINGITDALLSSSTLTIDGEGVSQTPETGHSSSVVITMVNNISDYLPTDHPYYFYNTEEGDSRPLVIVDLHLQFTETQSIDLSDAPFDIFIFRTHERGQETHLKNKVPTDKVDETLFGTDDDTSNQINRWYLSTGNLPWSIEISGEISHPLEKVDILQAYPDMKPWIDSNGAGYQDWYQHPASNAIWSR